MPETLELPVISFEAVPQGPIGIPLSPAAISLEAMTPGAAQVVVGALRQLESQVLDPLLYGTSTQDLPAVFQGVYHRFVPAYLSAILAILAGVEQDPQRVAALASRGFAEARRTLRDRGPARIGHVATEAALMGLETMMRVTRRAIVTPAAVISASPQDLVSRWVPLALAHALTLFAVTSFLSRDEQLRGGASNASVLAKWSKQYAVQVYDLSKSLGLLASTVASGTLPSGSDEEGLQLANEGLDHYRELLDREETADGRE